MHRRSEAELDFLHSFKKHHAPSKSLSTSTIHSPMASGLGGTPVISASASLTALNIHTRSRSGSEARPINLAGQFGLSSRVHVKSTAGEAVSSAQPSVVGSTSISPAHPPALRAYIPRSSNQEENDISLDALSSQPPLPPYPPASPRQTPPSSSNLHVNCDTAFSSLSFHTASALSPSSARLTPSLGPASCGHRKNSSSFLASTLHAHIGRLVEVDMVGCIKAAYARTAAQIKGMGDAASYGGSTAVSVLLWYHPLAQETRLYASNIGDSRALLIRDGGRPELLSHLHIGRDPSEQARVRAAGGRIMQNGRLAGCLEVTRAFGDQGMISFGLIAEPFIVETVLQPTDTHLLVSSDGLFDVLTYEEIARMLRQAPTELTAQQLAFALIEAAMKRKSRDNMSVVVVKLTRSIERNPIVTAVEAGSSGSLASSTVGSGSSSNNLANSKEDLLAATSALVDQFIAKPLARVPSLASIYAKPAATASSNHSISSSILSHDAMHSSSNSSSLSASPDPAGVASLTSNRHELMQDRTHSASSSPVPLAGRNAPSDFSILEEAGRASSVPNSTYAHLTLQSSPMQQMHQMMPTPQSTRQAATPLIGNFTFQATQTRHSSQPMHSPPTHVAALTHPLSPINAHSPSHGMFAFSPITDHSLLSDTPVTARHGHEADALSASAPISPIAMPPLTPLDEDRRSRQREATTEHEGMKPANA
jgi:serine/threonine protein phosphatase PrpC